MAYQLKRSIQEPIREGLNWDERWKGPDQGLIFCWEVGRQDAIRWPELAERARSGELMPLDWKGGVTERLKKEKRGTLMYLATWQGMRGDDLSIDMAGEQTVVCVKTGQAVLFSSREIEEE